MMCLALANRITGQVTDERGNPKPVAILQYRINGQFIMEGLAASFMFTIGGEFKIFVNGLYCHCEFFFLGLSYELRGDAL